MWIKLSTITCNDHPRQLQCVPGGVVQPVKVGQNCALDCVMQLVTQKSEFA